VPGLLDQHGRPLRLAEKLGEGGEGAVFRLADYRDVAVKVYGSPLNAERARKIQILTSMARPEVQRFTAWPMGLAFDDQRRPRGLVLPVVERAKDIHHLYSPRGRRDHFPDADWRYLVHVAANVARAFAAVHDLGLVIGDVNHGSVLVTQDGTVRLIDVDSFQVLVPGGPPLLCTVAVPLFQPPELFNADLSTQLRTPNHDCFGLAVLVFQLLLQGRHPYAGRYLGAGDMPIERAIPEHRFAFSAAASLRQMQPPPGSVGLNILPHPIAAMFEAAFAPDAAARGRPTAAQWVEALKRLATTLVKCPRNTTHHYPRALAMCPWCDFEQRTAVVLFGFATLSGSVRVGSASMFESEFTKLLAFAQAVPAPAVAYPAGGGGAVTASQAATIASGTARSAVLCHILGVVAAVVGVVVLPAGVGLIAIGLILFLVGSGISLRRRSPWITAYREAKAEYTTATEALDAANKFPRYGRVAKDVTAATEKWHNIPAQRAQMYYELECNKRREQLRHHLEMHLIERASIHGVGPGRLAMLSSYGIDTAADIEYRRVSQVPQFGPALTDRLVQWRQRIERAFVFDPSKPLPKAAVMRVEKELENLRRISIEQLRRAVQSLREASAADHYAARQAADRVTATAARLRQAEADALAALGELPD
jgi:DNA-binding helix-hairpin-helix protein with protein kinase domain